MSVTMNDGLARLVQSGLALHQQGRLAQARECYERVLAMDPAHAEALHLLGTLAVQTGHFQQAVELLEKSLRAAPGHPVTWCNLGFALQGLKRLDSAIASYDKAIAIQPDYAQAYSNRGNALQQAARFEEAVASYDRAILIKPDFSEAFHNRGIALQELDQSDLAVISFDRAIAINPANSEAFYSRGTALEELKRYREAVSSFDQAIALRPDYGDAFFGRGIALRALGRLDDAVASYDRAIAIRPNYAEVYNNRASALQELKRLDEAVASCEAAIAIRPDYAEAFNTRGNALLELKRLDEAVLSYDRAVSSRPDFAEALYNRGIALKSLNRLDDAVRSFEAAMAIQPDHEFLRCQWLHARMAVCDWRDLSNEVALLASDAAAGSRLITPFLLLGLIDDPQVHHLAARAYAAAKYPTRPYVAGGPRRGASERIRIGYYSADFHNHATAYLIAELFEQHDRGKFEIYGFSLGADTHDEMRDRISSGVDYFIDVTTKSDVEVARMSRDLGIDIAVDLKGFTQGARTAIFAQRCAPIQVNFLGYPGTMGSPCIDYVIADEVVIPRSSQEHFTEKIAYLPFSYQVNDSRRRISDRVLTRSALGLPESSFVFCCFNNPYKILPDTFSGWMRILGAVEESVIWLFEDNPTVTRNLRAEAEARGIAGDRLVFGQPMNLSDHLARHRLADLFLDTFPCNAHTTASDALWSGLPLLTCAGKSFASRVAASLLNAVGLPELITYSQQEFETKAIALATDRRTLAGFRGRLEQNRLTSPLFNAKRFARDIEVAYSLMVSRYRAGLPVDHIDVKP